MALAVWLLGAMDVLLTEYGLRLGVIEEANPVMAILFAQSHLLAALFSLLLSGTMLLFLHHCRHRCKLALHSLKGLLLLRLLIMSLHANWIAAII